jgi:hypothetical protein
VGGRQRLVRSQLVDRLVIQVFSQERARLGDELGLISSDREPGSATDTSGPITSSKSVYTGSLAPTADEPRD